MGCANSFWTRRPSVTIWAVWDVTADIICIVNLEPFVVDKKVLVLIYTFTNQSS